MALVTISDDDFHRLIAKRAQTLLGLANYLTKCSSRERFLIRPFLGEFFSQSMQIEELLDAYDARNNCQWCLFRSIIAAIKLFSDVSSMLCRLTGCYRSNRTSFKQQNKRFNSMEMCFYDVQNNYLPELMNYA